MYSRQSKKGTVYSANGSKFPQVQSVKVEYEKESILGMYEGAGYATRKGVIHIEADNSVPLPRPMTKEECKSHVV